jgi:uncharacterized repeat protein (TIGR03803 family)
VVFALNVDGTGFTNLHNFTGGNGGAEPQARLVLSGKTLYGTTAQGGRSGKGTVFAVNTDGSGFTSLHNFTGGGDGSFPQAGLVLSGNTLYGTASFGGGGLGAGTMFALNINGLSFTNLHTFDGDDGAWPETGLILSGNTLYGTTFYGGNADGGSNDGTLFKLDLNDTAKVRRDLNLTVYGKALHLSILGTVITKLHDFTPFARITPYANSDGARPRADLILSGNTLYGTTAQGGSQGRGAVFAVNTDGSSFRNLHSFAGGTDGAHPDGRLILSGDSLYGATAEGGSSDRGTVFRLSLNDN